MYIVERISIEINKGEGKELILGYVEVLGIGGIMLYSLC